MEDSDQEPSAGMTTASTASSVSTIDQAVVTQADFLERLEQVRQLITGHLEKIQKHFDLLEKEGSNAVKFNVTSLQFMVSRAVGAENLNEKAKEEIESSVKQIYKSAQDRLIFCRVQVEKAYHDLLGSLQQQHVTTTSPEGDLGQSGSVSSGSTNLTSGNLPVITQTEALNLTFPGKTGRSENLETLNVKAEANEANEEDEEEEEPPALNLACSTAQKFVVELSSSSSSSLPSPAPEHFCTTSEASGGSGGGGDNHQSEPQPVPLPPPSLSSAVPAVQTSLTISSTVQYSPPVTPSVMIEKEEQEEEEEVTFLCDVPRPSGSFGGCGVPFVREEVSKPVIERTTEEEEEEAPTEAAAQTPSGSSRSENTEQLPNPSAAPPPPPASSQPATFETPNSPPLIKPAPVAAPQNRAYFLTPLPSPYPYPYPSYSPHHSPAIASMRDGNCAEGPANRQPSAPAAGDGDAKPLEPPPPPPNKPSASIFNLQTNTAAISNIVHLGSNGYYFCSSFFASKTQTLHSNGSRSCPCCSCPCCSSPFSHQGGRTQVRDPQLQCLFKGCNKVMVDEDKWDRHVHSFNGSKGRYICLSKQCIACFTDQKELKDHIDEGHKPFKETCGKCKEQFPFDNPQKFADHWKTFHVEGKYRCTACSRTFSLVNEVLVHWNLANHDRDYQAGSQAQQYHQLLEGAFSAAVDADADAATPPSKRAQSWLKHTHSVDHRFNLNRFYILLFYSP
ncbi:hypothetical protein TYRP_006874 [Tyrophagus putrescentiae]|nr:hypothetical protein TYRP_006874 [Tyrophagus putrescentiae]